MAEVAYQRGQLDIAFEHPGEGITLCRSQAFRRPFAAALATLARVRWAEGNPAAAMDALAGAPAVEPSRGVTGLLNPIPSLRARLIPASGDLAAAIRWTNDRRLGAADDLSQPREPEYLVLARVLLAEGQVGQVLKLLDRLHSLAEGRCDGSRHERRTVDADRRQNVGLIRE